MGSLDSALTRQALARGLVKTVVDDTPVAIRLFYVGTGAVTSVTTTTATNIVNVTTDGGTDTYAFATYTTVGSLVAAINADGIFEARAIDSLLDDATASKFVDGAITAGADEDGRACWDVLTDTSVLKAVTVNLSPVNVNFAKPPKGHRVHLQQIVYNIDISGAAANGVRVYKRTAAGVETQIARRASVDATATTISWASGFGKITGRPDEEIIVRVIDGTSVTDAAANFLEVQGAFE